MALVGKHERRAHKSNRLIEYDSQTFRFPEVGVTGGCDQLRREPKLGPLEMQQEFLIADPSHQPN